MIYLGQDPVGISAGGLVNDVQVNGESVVQNGTANVPMASATNLGVVKVPGVNYGISKMADGTIYTASAVEADTYYGTNGYKAITPATQHTAVFYGLAKIAGAIPGTYQQGYTTGTYTDEAKIAIQKMLGIYEAPWELIREDTFTNETSQAHEITVDANGEPFELTEVRFLFEFPMVDTPAQTNYYGQIWFYYNNNNNYLVSEGGSFSRTATDNAKGSWHILENRNGMTFLTQSQAITDSNAGYLKTRFVKAANETSLREMGIIMSDDFSVTKVVIKPVTGTCHYRLFGRRKWN